MTYKVTVNTRDTRTSRLAMSKAEQGVQSIVAAGAISNRTGNYVKLTNTDGALANTLADGFYVGQEIYLVCIASGAGGSNVVTPANLAGGTTLTYDAAAENSVLKWDGSNWNIKAGLNTATLA